MLSAGATVVVLTTLIISEKPWNTGTFADMDKEFTTDLLLLRKEPWYAQHRESQTPREGSTQMTPNHDNFIYRPWRRFFTPHAGRKGTPLFLCPLLRSRGIRSLAPCGFSGAILAGQGVYTWPLKITLLLRNKIYRKGVSELWQFSAWSATVATPSCQTTICAIKSCP